MCDCLVALGPATVSGRTLFAKNSDRPPDEVQVLEWFAPRREDATTTTYLTIEPSDGDTIGFIGSRPDWMWGVEHGVNVAGVAAGNATIYTTLDPRDAPPALTGMDLVRIALERGASARAAVDVIVDAIARHGQGGACHDGGVDPYWSSFLVADGNEAYVVETSGNEYAIEKIERTRATSNRTTIPDFDVRLRHPRQPVGRWVDPRLRASEAVLADEPVSVESLTAHLRSHAGGEDGYTVCMHADVQATRASLVAELPADGSPPTAWVSTGSPCTSVFREVDL